MRLIIILLLLPSLSHANSFTLNLASKHAGTHQFNESNAGVGFNYYLSKDKFVSIGQYKNSINRQSIYIYAGKTYKRRINKLELGYGVIAGLITGYNDSILPLILPRLHIKAGKYQINTFIVPAIKGMTPTTVGFQLEIFI